MSRGVKVNSLRLGLKNLKGSIKSQSLHSDQRYSECLLLGGAAIFKMSILLFRSPLLTVQFQSPPKMVGNFPINLMFSLRLTKKFLSWSLGPYTAPKIKHLPDMLPLISSQLSLSSLLTSDAVKSREFFIKMPTPLLFFFEL